jgi:type IV secretion system protein VirB10
MRLAMKLPPKSTQAAVANDIDPREAEPLDVIDLASRNAYPVVAAKRGKVDGLGMAAGIALVAGLGLVTMWSMSAARLEKPETVGNPNASAPAPVTVPAPVAQTAPPPGAVPAPVAQADPAPSPVYAAPRRSRSQAAPATNPNSSPTVVFDATGRTAAAPAGAATEAPGAPAMAGGANDFASRVGGVGGAAARASAMANPSTTVTQGTLIPAVLETAIDTNVPGYVRAVVSQDVRSFDGTRVLVPRSSRLIGQYQSGLQNGQRRAYVIWTRLIRPDGASVNLASPAVGFDGTTGLAGDVSGNSFFKRFGSAMLLSVVGGLGGLVSGGASLVVGGASQSAAATAAQQDGQRGPVVRVRQGEPIRIFTARDLDFSGVS